MLTCALLLTLRNLMAFNYKFSSKMYHTWHFTIVVEHVLIMSFLIILFMPLSLMWGKFVHFILFFLLLVIWMPHDFHRLSNGRKLICS